MNKGNYYLDVCIFLQLNAEFLSYNRTLPPDELGDTQRRSWREDEGKCKVVWIAFIHKETEPSLQPEAFRRKGIKWAVGEGAETCALM